MEYRRESRMIVSTQEPFPVINAGVKQGCVMDQTLFSMLSSEDVGIELRSRTDGGFYSPRD